MDRDSVAALPAAAFKRGVKRVKRSPRTASAVILGFDCEYDSNTNEIVCYQLSDGTNSALLPSLQDLTWAQLAHWVRVSLQRWGYALTECRNILLVSHFSTAELSHIQDFWVDSEVRRVSPQQVYNATYRVNEAMVLHVVDLYHFFNTSLDRVAKTFGEQKLDYDTTNITRGNLDDPDFHTYAVHDAVLCARIFTKFRERVWGDHGVDVIRYPTPASIAMAVYRKTWLREDLDAAPPDIRRMAWRCLWGGRAEAYYAGDIKGDWTLRDVKSLYPRACELLKRLPRHGDWYRATEPTTWRGLCNVKFEFPPTVKHPCLPVYAEDRLIFPLSGISDCTLDEARAAAATGAKLHWRTVWEYSTGDDTLPRYMTHWTRQKDLADKEGDKVGRELSKLFMNALIGKFSQHKGDVDIEEAKAAAEAIGVPLETVLDPSFHHPLKPTSAPRIGGNIMPEWSALILGKARAVMADLLHRTDSLLCSTDSVLVPAHQDPIVDSIMDRLGVHLTSKNENKRPDGSPICPKCPTPHLKVAKVRIIRSRCYVGLCPHGYVAWSATHAVHLPRKGDLAANFILGTETRYVKTQRTGLKTAARTHTRFFSPKRIPMTFNRTWDHKRILTPQGDTRPWPNASEYLRRRP